jgi:hypothetical protein
MASRMIAGFAALPSGDLVDVLAEGAWSRTWSRTWRRGDSVPGLGVEVERAAPKRFKQFTAKSLRQPSRWRR